jgi:DNA-binding beta-propeller fold protein YncE
MLPFSSPSEDPLPASMRAVLAGLLLGFAFCANAVAQDRSASRLFSFIGDYPLGASVNRTDYQSIDAAARRLYISKMGGGQLLVFDLEKNKLAAQLDGFPKITGVLVVPEFHKLYASVPGSGVLSSIAVGLGMAGLSAGHGEVAIRDTRTLKELGRVPAGVFPDGIACDPKHDRIFVSDELGSAVTVIDGATDKLVSRIDTGGEVGNVRYDSASGNIFVPIQSLNELIGIDPKKGAVITRHGLAGCEHPHGFIVAPKGRIGYIACDENDQLVTIDLGTGHVMNKQPVVHDPDVLAIDPQANRLYVASEAGALSTYNIAVPEKPASLGDVYIAPDAHTVAADPVSHRLYFALADLNGRAILRVLAPKSN